MLGRGPLTWKRPPGNVVPRKRPHCGVQEWATWVNAAAMDSNVPTWAAALNNNGEFTIVRND